MKKVSSITVKGSKSWLPFFTRLKIDREKRISVSAKSPSISVLRIWNLESVSQDSAFRPNNIQNIVLGTAAVGSFC